MLFRMMDKVLGGPMNRFETWARKDPGNAFAMVCLGGVGLIMAFVVVVVVFQH